MTRGTMTGDEQIEAVRRYVMIAAPVTSTTRGGAYRQAWLASKADMAHQRFRDILRSFGWLPVPNGELWTLEFRGAS